MTPKSQETGKLEGSNYLAFGAVFTHAEFPSISNTPSPWIMRFFSTPSPCVTQFPLAQIALFRFN